MERKGDHALLLAKVDADHAVIVSNLSGLQLFVSLGTLVHLEVLLYLCVGNPD